MGDGTTIEMMSSQKNCVKQNLQKSRWAYYGIPDWLETDAKAPVAPAPVASKRDEVIVNIQKWCNDYCGAGLVVDGEFGPKTKKGLCKALQTYLNRAYNAGLSVDGAFGPKTKQACKVVKGKNELTYICQAMLYCLGYDMKHSIANNKLDGEYGNGTRNAILKYQQNTRGLRHDGECGPATFYAMFNS
jgi:peptidoglycan hydrolase-like protein with peptidoglycan-binding domain